MVTRIQLLLLTVVLLAWPGWVLAQRHQDVNFDAQTSREKMLVNSTLEYQVTLRNAQGTDFQPPNFKDFIVISGPGRSMGTSIVNGVTSTYQSYSWVLQPKRTGKLSIGPASIRAANRTYRSNSKSVEVLAVDAEMAALAPDNFLRLELSTDTAYVGEQVIINLQLYTTDNVVSRHVVAEPNLDAFFSYPRRQFDGRSRRVLENGKEYLSRTIASVALYPLKSGALPLEPYRVLLGVIRYRNPQSTFSRRYTERIPLQTDSLVLQVLELPRPRPTNFSGGVGRFRLQVNASPEELTTDDAITVRLSISGEGDVKRITNPVPVDEKDWVIYDPEVLSEEFFDGPTGIYGRKVLEYKIVPRRAGEYGLIPRVNYFDVDSNKYVNLEALQYDVKVTQGSGQVVYETEAEEDSTQALVMLPSGSVGTLKNYDRNGMSGGLLAGLVVLPLLLFGGLFLREQRQKSLAAIDPADLARDRAAKLAARHLKEAREQLRTGDAAAFYNAIEDALLGYLRNKFKLPVADLNKRNIRQQLLEHGAKPDIAEEYVQLLQRCEQALYAGQVHSTDLHATYQTAKDLLQATERTG